MIGAECLLHLLMGKRDDDMGWDLAIGDGFALYYQRAWCSCLLEMAKGRISVDERGVMASTIW